jgi:hypothetical protein
MKVAFVKGYCNQESEYVEWVMEQGIGDYDLEAFLDAGCSTDQLLAAGASCDELLNAGVASNQLESYDCVNSDSWCPCDDGSYSADCCGDDIDEGIDPYDPNIDSIVIGYCNQESEYIEWAMSQGFVDYDVIDFFEAGCSTDQVIDAGASCQDFLDAGLDVDCESLPDFDWDGPVDCNQVIDFIDGVIDQYYEGGVCDRLL